MSQEVSHRIIPKQPWEDTTGAIIIIIIGKDFWVVQLLDILILNKGPSVQIP